MNNENLKAFVSSFFANVFAYLVFIYIMNSSFQDWDILFRGLYLSTWLLIVSIPAGTLIGLGYILKSQSILVFGKR